MSLEDVHKQAREIADRMAKERTDLNEKAIVDCLQAAIEHGRLYFKCPCGAYFVPAVRIDHESGFVIGMDYHCNDCQEKGEGYDA